ncbi:4-vinyl reductase [Mesorhizobium sp. 1M-11]|uniref:4-vinyl reductase n=1 Tax=Mesorhizobium sp. 1M-11 TaxID=1529006 RepID=UPI0006C756D4|nr:4-vinyl reductase [Mesorhizobium sp. 1M-11]
MLPSVDINVDEATGIWETDGLPMLYIPRHFMVNVHKEVESALGLSRYRDVLYQAGAKSAYYWCRKQAETYDISGFPVFEHYLERLTARGWGQFKLERVAEDLGSAEIAVQNSIYALESPSGADHATCYMFEGFFAGGLQYLFDEQGRKPFKVECREVQCEAMGFECCRFEITRVQGANT